MLAQSLQRNSTRHGKGSRFAAKHSTREKRDSIELYLILLPVLLHIFIFCTVPLYGIVIAFQDYNPGSPFISFDGSVKWVGFKHFIELFTGPYFWRLLRNTLRLSLYCLLFGFPLPIVFALLLNEIKGGRFKKFMQTLSCLPYFISSVVAVSIVLTMVMSDGIVNRIIVAFGGKAVSINAKAEYFPALYTVTRIWRSFGWDSILFLAAMSSIDTSLYEAADIDGANRMDKMWHITIPGIKPTIILILVFNVGAIMSSNTEMILLMYNTNVYETADVFGTYVYRSGLLEGRFSFGTAVTLFQTMVNFMLVFGANMVARKLGDNSIW